VGVFSRIEGGLDNAFDRAAGAVFRGPIEPAQIAKRAEKQMNREKLVGAGKQYAPTLYTVLVNPGDNRKLFGFYPTMAAEIETYLLGKGTQNGLKFDGRPLVRFIVDEKLKSGKFDVIAEAVAAPIIAQLREEEREFYGLGESPTPVAQGGKAAFVGAGAAVGAGIAGASAVLSPLAPGDVPGKRSGDAFDNLNDSLDDLWNAGDAQDAREARDMRDARKNPLTSIPAVGSPSSAVGQARLFDLNAGKSYALTKSALVLGRDSSCDIVLDDANVSRRHAQLTQDVIGTWKLTDLNSTNGTRINGNRVTNALLRDGDGITIGVTVLEFRGS
jgi:hypothetical protein